MTIREIYPQPDYTLRIVADDGRVGVFDVTPYLQYDAFAALKNPDMFERVVNGGYFIEWECGADLSADTIEARWQTQGELEMNEPAAANDGDYTTWRQNLFEEMTIEEISARAMTYAKSQQQAS